MNGDTGPDDSLSQAQATIARQAEEIERLRRRVADERFAEDLRDAITVAMATGTIASPLSHSRLLEMIVETAAHVISARAGSLFLVDEENQELTFEVALGEKAQDVKKLRVPLGHGIAGLVAVSGQPMAISNAESDPRQAGDIAQRVGYVPHSLLCVPLFVHDQVIGVLELLDKEGTGSFTIEDMEALGLFANQAAVAIEQSRTYQHLSSLMVGALQSLEGLSDPQRQVLQERSRSFTAGLEESRGYREALDLARLIQDIAWRGESELQACRTMLQGFADYLRARPAVGGVTA